MNLIKQAVLSYFTLNKNNTDEDDVRLLSSFLQGQTMFIGGFIDNEESNLYIELISKMEMGSLKISNLIVHLPRLLKTSNNRVILDSSQDIYLRGNTIQILNNKIYRDLVSLKDIFSSEYDVVFINSSDEQILLINKAGILLDDISGIDRSFYISWNEVTSRFVVYIKIVDVILDIYGIDYIQLETTTSRERKNYITLESLGTLVDLSLLKITL